MKRLSVTASAIRFIRKDMYTAKEELIRTTKLNRCCSLSTKLTSTQGHGTEVSK
uniref:Uncharacterized protein n=1 Tax=Arundo donax TaxID=35708 RepID=A0A0A8Z971_ARUDO